MVRTNVVIDESLVTQVMDRFGLETRRSAIDFALHAVLGHEAAPITDEEAREIWGDEVPDGPNAKQAAKKREPR